MRYVDAPKYRVRPVPGRFLFNKAVLLILLGSLLYLGIYVNYYLLNRLIPSVLNWIFFIGILLSFIMELAVCYVRYGNYIYEFYNDRIIINEGKKHTVSYSNIIKAVYASNFFDKWFNTGSIILELSDGKKLMLKYLNNPNQAYFLIQKHLGSDT